jgi:hypothetical protein
MAAPAWAQRSGFETEWDVRKLLASLTSESQRVKPILIQADPNSWSDRAAAQSYLPQWTAAQNEIQYLAMTSEAFAKQPERLTLAMETFFRLESLERTLQSFVDGLKRYGNPAVAELLEGTLRDNSNNRERLREYLTELARTKEQEYRIMDEEAQRCRALLSKQPPGKDGTPKQRK